MLNIYTTPILQVALDYEHLVEAKQLENQGVSPRK